MTTTKNESPNVLAHNSSSASSVLAFAVGENHYITDSSHCKEENSDFTPADRLVYSKYAPKHRLSEALSDSYGRIGWFDRSVKVYDCGSFLQFLTPQKDSANSFLYRANFCKDRLCPMCAYRRELKVFAEISKAFDRLIRSGKEYSFLFLTLTIRSVEGEKLTETINRMQKAFQLFAKRSRFKKACRGYFKALEITCNKDKGSASYGLYHPHFHIIVAVDKDYFKSNKYIPHPLFLQMWRESYNDPEIAFVNVETIYSKKKVSEALEASVEARRQATAEVAKYTVKSSDFLLDKDAAETDKRVETLSEALKGRRLIDLAGCFREALQGVDLESPDPVSDRAIDPDLLYIVEKYHWHVGASTYDKKSCSLSGAYLKKEKELLGKAYKTGQQGAYFK